MDWAAGALAEDEGQASARFTRSVETFERLELPALAARVLRAEGTWFAERDPAAALV